MVLVDCGFGNGEALLKATLKEVYVELSKSILAIVGFVSVVGL
ncbi:hypothetical protein HanPI659440_Chr07g0263831 [Helianthus annuus]|nr:hypothetical protein HanHA300_Chr07g0243181 [Helianthus annuus]KAJ0563196.1 hypothetical protein HanHA89_Chr07g0260341 [Helianthus annuus]KAJ0731306.1 hypothetical protein HanOQP8_Chr07g0250441 [Helianthus annuus]KAJ0770982.1 hypothetical protein HanPI659440_Chr07g0263831 [Helianthus annuus]KAJ0904778.1 hypothetical protein HanPSC8_Chr07g0286201 [Helianthus annuus]